MKKGRRSYLKASTAAFNAVCCKRNVMIRRISVVIPKRAKNELALYFLNNEKTFHHESSHQIFPSLRYCGRSFKILQSMSPPKITRITSFRIRNAVKKLPSHQSW